MADFLVVQPGPASHLACNLAGNHQDPSLMADFLVVRQDLRLMCRYIWQRTTRICL